MKLPAKLRLSITVLYENDDVFLGPEGEPDFDVQKDFPLGAVSEDMPEDVARKLSKVLREAADDLRFMADQGEPIATEFRLDRNSRLN